MVRALTLAAALAGDPLGAATRLLGCVVTHATADGLVAVRLTEVEAYGGPDDPGSHGFRGRTRRNATMFGPPGRAYVYFTYGMHWCLNVSCGPDEVPGAVLLRGGEVVEGLALARSRRPGAGERDLARGPARLTRALAVTGELDGAALLDPGSPLQLRDRAAGAVGEAVPGPRTGVGGAGAALPWRLHLAGEPSVSPYRAHVRRRRAAPAPEPEGRAPGLG